MMMRTYLAAGALGASLLGLGVATAPIASAHDSGGGRSPAAAQEREGRETGGVRDGDGRQPHDRDGAVAVSDERTDRDGQGCDHDGPTDGTAPATPPEGVTPAPAPTDVNAGDQRVDEQGRHAAWNPWAVLSDTLGLTPDQVRDALAAGQSIDELAVAQGVDPAVVHAALTAEHHAKVDRMVAKGWISAEEGAQAKAYVDALVAYVAAFHFTPAPAATSAA